MLSRGSLILRILNIGKAGAVGAAAPGSDSAARAHRNGRKTRVRAKAAYDIANGSIARELAGDGGCTPLLRSVRVRCREGDSESLVTADSGWGFSHLTAFDSSLCVRHF